MTRRLGWPIGATGWTRRRALRWAALAVAACAGLSGWWHLAAGAAHADGWVVECVDCPKRFQDIGDRSLRLDSAGHPHIAFGGDHLYYTWHDGAAWHTETVDASPDVGEQASLALDLEGDPHVIYYASGYDRRNAELRYAYRDATGWHVETIAAGEPHESSLALDASGHPRVSYFPGGRDDTDLRFAYRDAAGWHTEIVDSRPRESVGWHNSLVVDQEGYAHISYNDSDYFGDLHDHLVLKYARQDADGWHTEVVDREGCRAYDISMALDSESYAHVSYYDYCTHALRHAYQDLAGWHVETITVLDEAWPQDTSLAVDGAGNVHISYSDGDNRQLGYAYRDGAGWHLAAADSAWCSLTNTSLAVDGNGYARISYLNPCERELRYAAQDAGGWHRETVDQGPAVGSHASLALDARGGVHISYRDATNQDLKHAYRDASGWKTEVVDSTGDVGHWGSLALDAGGWPHITYHDLDLGQLKHAYQDAAGWHLETVDSGADAGANTSLALDGSGFAHVSYGKAGSIRYAYNDTAGWHRETVDEEGYTGWKSSLALDGDGAPHINYLEWANVVKYAFRDASGWHIETVDSGSAENLSGTCMALDGEGRPHIGYNGCWQYDQDYPMCVSYGLVYARRDAASWHYDNPLVWASGTDVSLALDSNGFPHFTYGRNGSLGYTYRDSAGWQRQTLDSAGRGGESHCLALDGDGNAHIAYLDSSENHLKYAHNAIPRMRWVGPGDDMLLTRAGALLEVAYANIAVPDTMTATLSGPATFADGTQILSVVIASTKGAHLLALRPAAEATPPGEFDLHLTLADLELDMSGTVARETFLPSLAQGHPACPPHVDQVALYVESGYMGQCVVKGVGDYPTYRDIGLPFDSISSLRVGAHVQATMCSDGQFEGTCEVFTADDNTLVDNPVGDDEVSSVRVEPRPGAE